MLDGVTVVAPRLGEQDVGGAEAVYGAATGLQQLTHGGYGLVGGVDELGRDRLDTLAAQAADGVSERFVAVRRCTVLAETPAA